MKSISLSLLLLISKGINAQQRLGFDFNTSGSNLYATFSYQKVIGSNFILNGGLLFGELGRSTIKNNRDYLNGTNNVISPIASANQSTVAGGNYFDLLTYYTKERGISLQLGFGYFHEFSIKHGLKFSFLGRLGFVETELQGLYYSNELNKTVEKYTFLNHFIGGISPEIAHTIRINGRMTMCYGFKLPYFIRIQQNGYIPMNVKDRFYGLEPEFSFGITYVVGKCDE